MRRQTLFIFFLFSAIFLLAGLAHPRAQSAPSSRLQVIEVSPAPASPLALDAAITFFFNRRVDCAAVEAALSWSPAIPGLLSCDEYSLTFSPASAYERDTTYSFTLNPPLAAKDGAPLLEAYRQTFHTVGYLEVAEAFPSADGGQAPVDSAITVIFDRPIVPLALYSDSATLPQPLQLNPETAGQGEWVNSAVYVFRPAQLLQSDTVYRATIAAALTAVDGASLPAAYSWTFQTAAPAVLAVEPPLGSGNLSLEPKIQVRFNQALAPELVERAFSLRALPADEGGPVAGAFEWAADGLGFAFSPALRLELDTVYEASFDAALIPTLKFSNQSGAPSWRYTTVPPPAIKATEPANKAVVQHGGSFSLFFASPMNIETLADRITIEPAPAFEPRAFYSDWSNRYTVSFDARPSTTYTVRIAPGMQDIYGNAISEALTFSYTTAARPPALGMNVPGEVGFYAADRAPTQLYIYHRGLSQVDLALYRVPLLDFVGQLTDDEQYAAAYRYRPSADDLLKSWRIDSDTPENTTRYELLELADDGKDRLDPGLYFLELESPGLERHYERTRHFLNVATAVLTVKQTTDRLTVWAVDVASGAALSGENIRIYGKDARLLGSGLTDERGIAQVDIPYTRDLYSGFVAVLASAEQFGVGYSNWSNGTEPWQFGYEFSFFPRAFQSYLYTDRPVYRTGQPVYFRGLLRSKDDVVYMPPPLETVPVTIRDARGEIVYQRDLPLSDFGSFNDSFDIAPAASLGAYQISVELPTEDEYYVESDGVGFLVAEYRLPEYQVTLSTEQPQIAQGASSRFTLAGKYFFGGPVSEAEAEYTIFSAPYVFDYAGAGLYDFGDYDSYAPPHEYAGVDSVVSEGHLRTDAAGQAQFELLGDLGDAPRSQRWRVEAAIRDEAGQTIYGSSSLIVHQGLFYLGARAENYVSRAGEDNRIKLIAVDWQSQPIANQPIDVQVLERRWVSVQEQDPSSGRTAWTWDFEEIPITSGAVTTDSQGKSDFVYQAPNGGNYKIIVSAQDAAGNTVRSATYAWVWGSSFVSWRQANNKTVEVVPAQSDYSVGERAQVLITSPWPGRAEALVSLERGDVLSVEHISLDSNSHIYEFEILPQHAPNIFVNVFLFKAVDAHNPIADWRVGMTQLQVDTERKALNIEIEADRESAAPQETVTYQLRVTDFAGEPVVAEVGLGLTDVAALSLAERNSRPLLESFYGPQELSVRTSSAPVMNADAVTANLSERKGGGGGVFDAGIIDLRGEFIDTPYWNPSLVTDAAGQATFEARLPDNLTTWRLDARAWTEGRAGRLLVGENTFDLLSTRPLLIRPVTPRFFIVGDVAQLAAVINNNTGKDISAQVSLENVTGLRSLDEAALTQPVSIPAGGRQRVTWLVEVADVPSVAPFFVVRSVDTAYSDASISPVSADFDGRLPVYRYTVPETVGTAGTLRTGGARVEALLLPRAYDVAAGQLDIRLEASLAGVMQESLAYLETETARFRECTTTIVNRFLPNIVAYRALAELDLARPELEVKLDELVSAGLQQLYARQLAGGGWSWCSYPRAEVLTSAYALLGLAEAQRAGYPVDAAVLRRAQRYIAQRLITPSPETTPRHLNRQAFLLYVLAQAGVPDVARSTTLFESRERLNLDAAAFLAQALYTINPADRLRLEGLAQQMLNKAITRASGTLFEESYQDRWNWSSDIRSTALVLRALLKIYPESELLPNIVRHLVSVRDARGHWPSRQENTWAIIALTDWLFLSDELNPNYAYSVTVNEEPLYSDVALPDTALAPAELTVEVAQLIQRETNLVEIQRDAGPGALYYTAHLNLDLPVSQIDAFSRGLEISRSYTLLEDETATAIDGAAVGDTVQVRLGIVAPNTLRYVVIEDFFPAGAEAINPDLATSPQLGVRPQGQRIDPQEEGWGWWFFDHIEFRDEKAVIYASYLPRGVYEYVYTIRPAIAGAYNVMPPTAQELYFPEVYGRGAGTLFTIVE